MTRICVRHMFGLGAVVLWSATAFAQADKVSKGYDRHAEFTTRGIVLEVVSVVGPDGAVGVHMNIKTDRGIVQVDVGPALFIGQNNFWFACDDEIDVTGAMVSHGGHAALWARTINKGEKTLRLRDDNGAPLWKADPAADPDGCGVVHASVR